MYNDRDREMMDIRRKLGELTKQLNNLARREVSPTPDSLVIYSGTPTAGRLAQWTGAGTVEQTAYAGSVVTQYSGVPVAGQLAVWSGAGTVFGTATFGTSSLALLGTPNVFTQGNTFSGTTSFTNNVTVSGNVAFSGTATAGTAFSVTRNLTSTSTNSPVVSIVQDHASDDQHALYLKNDGTASAALFIDDGSSDSYAILVASGGGTAMVVDHLGTVFVNQGIRALSSNGVTIYDDGGNVALKVEDGGNNVIIASNAYLEPYSGFNAQNNRLVIVRYGSAHSSDTPYPGFLFANNQTDGTDGIVAGLAFMNDAISDAEKRLGQIFVFTDTTTGEGQMRFYTFDDGVANLPLTLRASGRVGINAASASGQLHVDQASTTAAIPTLILDQADLSEEFIEFTSTVGAGNPIDTAALGSYYGRIRVNVTGVGYKFIPLYNT
jgi:hypothetical protein